MQARNMRVAARAQDLSQSNLDPHENKQLPQLADVAEGRPEDHRPEAGRSLGRPQHIFVLLTFAVLF